MPLYTFDGEDGRFEQIMTWTESQELLLKHPDLVRVIGAPRIVGGIGDRAKVDAGFKEVLSKISENNPNSPMAEQHGSKSTQDVKKRAVVQKHLYK
jgi:hypothetical protein